MEQAFGEQGDLGNFPNQREIADVFAQELLGAGVAPAAGEGRFALEKGFGEATMFVKCLPVGFREESGWAEQVFIRQAGVKQLGNRKRMHAVVKITPHQAITAAAEDIETRGAGDQHATLVGMHVEKSFEPVFPPSVFANLVEGDDRQTFG